MPPKKIHVINKKEKKKEQMSDEIRRSIEKRKYEKDLNIHFLCLINSFFFYSNYFGIYAYMSLWDNIDICNKAYFLWSKNTDSCRCRSNRICKSCELIKRTTWYNQMADLRMKYIWCNIHVSSYLGAFPEPALWIRSYI